MLEGIQDAVGDSVRVYYSEGCHIYKDRVENLGWKQDRISEALTVAEHSDVVVLCLGLDENLEGEEGDTGNSYASGDKRIWSCRNPRENFWRRWPAAVSLWYYACCQEAPLTCSLRQSM